MPIRFRTDPDGRIAVPYGFVDKTASTAFPSRLVPAPSQDGETWVYREVTDIRVVERWVPLAQEVADTVSVPILWLLAMVYAESRGNPAAEAKDGGWGLLQITHESLKVGYTKTQVFDPKTNLTIGARLLKKHAAFSQELPELASCFNAGGAGYGRPHPSEASPWGFRETTGHISRVVAANNAVVQMLKEGVCK